MSTIDRFDDFEVDYRLFQIRRRGHLVPVERRIFDLIAYLIQHRDRVVLKEELFREVWKGRVVTESSLTVAMAAARKALCDDPKQPTTITTHHGRGYRFVREAKRVVGDSARRLSCDSAAESETDFIGRRRELNEMLNALERTAAGRTHLFLLAGEAGIGKTRLAEEFASRAEEAGARVMMGRCKEAEGTPPFWPWVQAIRSYCLQSSDEDVRSLASKGPEVARILPELRDRFPDLPDPASSLDPTQARFQLFDGVTRFVRRISEEKRTVLIFDDLHRSDRPSLLLLEFLLSQIKDVPLLVVVTYREVGAALSEIHGYALASLAREGSTAPVCLGGLTVSEVADFVETRTGTAPSSAGARLIHETTGGNPFFLIQLLPLLKSGGEVSGEVAALLPQTARDAITQQVEGLPGGARRLLTVCAAIGREFGVATLAHASGIAEPELGDFLDTACRAGIISRRRGNPPTYRFGHILVRDVLYEELESGQRATLHRKIGEALEDLFRSNLEPHLTTIAHHYVEAVTAGCEEKAIEFCDLAGKSASTRLAYEEAAAHYATALSLVDAYFGKDDARRCDLLLRLGAEQARSGDRSGAKETFERAARAAEKLGAPDRLAEAALGVAPGFFGVEAGVRDEFLLNLLKRALAALGSRDTALEAKLSARLGMALFWSEDSSDSAALSSRAWSIASTVDDPRVKLFALYGRWLAEWRPEEFDKRYDIAQSAVRLALDLGDREMLSVCRLFQATCLLERGNILAFDQAIHLFGEMAQELKQPQAQWYSHLLRSTRALHCGHFEEAQGQAASFYEIGRRVGDANVYHSMMAQRLLVAGAMGDFERARSIAEEGCERYPVFIGWRAGRIWSLARLAEHEEARRELSTLTEYGLERLPRKLDWTLSMALLAEACALMEEKATGEQIYEMLLPLRGRTIVLGLCVMSWGAVERYLALLCQLLGRDDAAASWFEAAIKANSASSGEPWVTYCELEYARLLAGRGGRANEGHAAELASRARARAARLGMKGCLSSD